MYRVGNSRRSCALQRLKGHQAIQSRREQRLSRRSVPSARTEIVSPDNDLGASVGVAVRITALDLATRHCTEECCHRFCSPGEAQPGGQWQVTCFPSKHTPYSCGKLSLCRINGGKKRSVELNAILIAETPLDKKTNIAATVFQFVAHIL
jgi:hypothetical protein